MYNLEQGFPVSHSRGYGEGGGEGEDLGTADHWVGFN